jgi:hypothetical protein
MKYFSTQTSFFVIIRLILGLFFKMHHESTWFFKRFIYLTLFLFGMVQINFAVAPTNFNPLVRGKSDGTQPDGKKYGMIILKTGKELIGYLETNEHGSYVVKENTVPADKIANVIWLQKIVVRLKSQELIYGHLIRDENDHVEIEMESEPDKIRKIMRRDLDKLIEIKDGSPDTDKIAVGRSFKKPGKYPRLTVGAGWAKALGYYAQMFDNGSYTQLNIQQRWQTWFKWNSALIPDARLDAVTSFYKKDQYSYQGFLFMAGPIWLIDPFRIHSGRFYLGGLGGMALEQVSSAVYSGKTTVFTIKAVAGYEYLFPNGIILGVELHTAYSYDDLAPLTAIGASMKAGYQF